MNRFTRVFGQPASAQQIGFDGEKRSAKLLINVRGLAGCYPDATYVLTLRRSDGQAYPAVRGLMPDAQGMVEYELTRDDLALAGRLDAEAALLVGGETKIKSPIWTFTVAKSLAPGCCSPPPIVPHWVDDVLDRAQRALDAIEDWNQNGGSGALPDNLVVDTIVVTGL